jgi:hypothetical protein
MATSTNPNAVQNQPGVAEKDPRDWRFRMRLAPGSDVLYKNRQGPGILAPLAATDGVIFPYTPQVMVNYQANYSETTPTHSNYKQYFYQSSQISDIQITGTFTAQSTQEADYMLAAIHFFRSATKMFYGQDKERNGNPPPLVFLEGFGDNQFNNQPCVIQQFNYVLPPDVDYVRTTGPQSGVDLTEQRVARNGYRSALVRLLELFQNGISKGAENTYYGNKSRDLANAESSYVPTKIEIMLTLHPIVSRKRQSGEFSLKDYANGEGLRRGFW